jgi:hypothetical protein
MVEPGTSSPSALPEDRGSSVSCKIHSPSVISVPSVVTNPGLG